MENVIEIESLSKSYPGFLLNDVSFKVPKGYITDLLDPTVPGRPRSSN